MQLQVKRVSAAWKKSLWPRGQSKHKLKLDAWLNQIAPSDALRKWFGHEPDKWDGFRARYAKEPDTNPKAVCVLQDLLREHGTVTLLFDAHATEHNNALALHGYRKRRMPRKRSAPK